MNMSYPSDPDGNPVTEADVAGEMDLTLDPVGIPTPAADLEVTVQRFRLKFWKVWVMLDQHSAGPHSWLTPWCGLVLLTGVCAAIGAPLLLAPDESAATRLTVAAVTALMIFLFGGGLVALRFRMSRSSSATKSKERVPSHDDQR